MNYSRGLPTTRARAALALGALGLVLLISGCGGSGESSTITIGNENSKDNALATAGGATATTPSTPTSGPLATEPKVAAQSGAPPTKVVTKDLIVGTGPEAKAGQTVTVNYVGTLFKGGKVFDASWKRGEPFTFALGKGQVISGWDQGIAGMKVGGRRELIIPASFAYGAKGQPPAIPANAALVFVVDLLGT